MQDLIITFSPLELVLYLILVHAVLHLIKNKGKHRYLDSIGVFFIFEFIWDNLISTTPLTP